MSFFLQLEITSYIYIYSNEVITYAYFIFSLKTYIIISFPFIVNYFHTLNIKRKCH